MTESRSDEDVACQLCGKQIPRSAAQSAEGRDYTYFFCSEGCRQRWAANARFDRAPGERPGRR